MPLLIFLHTAAVHVQTFDALLRELEPRIAARHLVRSDLLARARTHGIEDANLRGAVRQAVVEAGEEGGVVLCTCSTIGGLAEEAAADTATRVLRVDRPMAQAAVEHGPRIVLAAALESTVEPTAALIRAVARQMSRQAEIQHLVVAGAWERFEAGDLDGYHQLIAAALSRVDDADVIVLAQASMAGASTLARLAIPVLASPELGVRAALAQMSARPAPADS